MVGFMIIILGLVYSVMEERVIGLCFLLNVVLVVC